VAGHAHGDKDQSEGRARVRARAWPLAEKKVDPRNLSISRDLTLGLGAYINCVITT
jgi:hypothetical protein